MSGLRTYSDPIFKQLHENRHRAKIEGSVFYHGRLCKKCGTTERYTKTACCRICTRKREADTYLKGVGRKILLKNESNSSFTKRKMALQSGDMTYEGMVCKKCETSIRYVNGSGCVSCRHSRSFEETKNSNLKYVYGMTLNEYNAMLHQQAYRCAICMNESDRLVVDHCHTTKKVRALLCHACNTGLGLFRENPSILRGAIHYVETWKQYVK